MFYKKGVIKKLGKFTVQESFFNKVADLRFETILKRDSDTGIFRNAFFTEHLRETAASAG